MKFRILQEDLARGLSIVGRAAAKRSTLPILAHVALRANDELSLKTTDLELGVETKVPAAVEGEGGITVPLGLFSDFIKLMPSEAIDFELDEKTLTLSLICGQNEATFKGMSYVEFPALEFEGGGSSVEFTPGDLRQSIERAIISAATEEYRHVLTGVQVRLLGNTLTLAAADGFRLSVCKKQLDWSCEGEIEILIPARALRELKRISDAKGEEIIKMHLAETRVMFEVGETRLYSQLIDGAFPDYKQIIPKECATTMTLNTGEFASSLGSVAIFAKDAADIVAFTIGEDGLKLQARSAEVGDGESVLDAVVSGDGLEIAFNVKYLLDVLAVVGTEQVVMEFTTASAPGVVRIPESDMFIYILMPMHAGG